MECSESDSRVEYAELRPRIDGDKREVSHLVSFGGVEIETLKATEIKMSVADKPNPIAESFSS